MNLLLLAIAPSIAILLFIYFSDKYEKEPLGILVKIFFFGVLTCIPSAIVEMLFYIDAEKVILPIRFIDAFLVVGLTEEGFKWLFLYLGIWKNKNFSEVFDGIVYAVFVSLGFATLENILYVFNHGVSVGIGRAIFSVPTHAMLGVLMGYYFGLAKFYERTNNEKAKNKNLIISLVIPVALHGLYDFLLMVGTPITNILSMILVFVLGAYTLNKINNLKYNSIYFNR